jgi:hypothetical protein
MDARTWFTPKQKAELWERWKSGQCVADIARASMSTRPGVTLVQKSAFRTRRKNDADF